VSDEEKRRNLQEDISSLKKKLEETSESIVKAKTDLKTLEGERGDLQKGGSSSNKEKIFTDKLNKIKKDLQMLEGKLKDLNTKKNKSEIGIEQCKKEAEELKAKIVSEEQRLKGDITLLKESEVIII
jgi:chromosome segregation ATPase